MRFASCMAPNAEQFFIETTHYLADRLGIDASIAHDAEWEFRERDLDAGNIEVGWICGLPYVWKADLPSPGIHLLAAPVMRAERYADQAVYYSDVMVHSDSGFQQFSDLRGARWAYNEPRSHSGSNVVKAFLFDLDEKDGYFGSVHRAGSHESAIDMILNDSVDGAAIDTTVYATWLRSKPDLGRSLRSVASLGPSPMPPWVISTRVAEALRARLRDELTRMHLDHAGAGILSRHDVKRFDAVNDSFYDPIRVMDHKARQVRLGDESN